VQVEEIPPYRFVVYNRADPRISQIDDRSERGTFLDKLAESSQEPQQKLENIRRIMQQCKFIYKILFEGDYGC
jgi:hypothetical protein